MSTNGSAQSPSPLVVTVQNWYRGLPMSTKALFTVITAIYFVQLCTGYDMVYGVCLSPLQVVRHFQVYRVLSAVLFHGGLMHVVFNMLAFVPMGCSLERLVGTVQFSYMVLALTLLEGVLFIAASYVLAPVHLLGVDVRGCAIGLSGVIFGLLVVDNAHSGAGQRSIFGLFTVPAHLYPWALLVFWQLLMPQVSFLGHLAGVVAGHLWVGASHTPLRVLLLSRPATGWLEGTWLVSRYLVPRPSFVMMPGSVLPYSTTDGASASAPARAGAGGGAAAAAGGSGDNSFRGYIAKLQTALRGSGAGGGGAGAGDAGDEESGAGAGSGGSGGKAAAFQGTARVLGGSGAAGGSVVPAATAAALAAEARMGGGAAAAGSRS